MDPEAARILRAELDHALASKQVLLVSPEPKRTCTDDGAKWMITFTEKDLDRVQLSHNDTLVVTLRIGAFNVRRVLVDQGRFCRGDVLLSF